MPAKKPPQAPHRVDVAFGERLPRGVIWGSAAVGFHAVRPHYSRSLGVEVSAAPAALEELRASIRSELDGTRTDHNWLYYRGRVLACPFRCTLDSATCPVDVLVEEVNKPSALLERVRKREEESRPQANSGVGL